MVFFNCSGRIIMAYRVVAAICKHVKAEGALAGGGVGVGVDEAAGGGVIITGLQIVQPGFVVVAVATTV